MKTRRETQNKRGAPETGAKTELNGKETTRKRAKVEEGNAETILIKAIEAIEHCEDLFEDSNSSHTIEYQVKSESLEGNSSGEAREEAERQEDVDSRQPVSSEQGAGDIVVEAGDGPLVPLDGPVQVSESQLQYVAKDEEALIGVGNAFLELELAGLYSTGGGGGQDEHCPVAGECVAYTEDGAIFHVVPAYSSASHTNQTDTPVVAYAWNPSSAGSCDVAETSLGSNRTGGIPYSGTPYPRFNVLSDSSHSLAPFDGCSSVEGTPSAWEHRRSCMSSMHETSFGTNQPTVIFAASSTPMSASRSSQMVTDGNDYRSSVSMNMSCVNRETGALISFGDGLKDCKYTPSVASRQSHNEKERKRRSRMKQSCEVLRSLIPGIGDKTDKATVLEHTVHYLLHLQRTLGYKCNDYVPKASSFEATVEYVHTIPGSFQLQRVVQPSQYQEQQEDGAHEDPTGDRTQTEATETASIAPEQPVSVPSDFQV